MSDYIVNVCGDSTNVSWLIKGESNILYEAQPEVVEKTGRHFGQGLNDILFHSESPPYIPSMECMEGFIHGSDEFYLRLVVVLPGRRLAVEL